MAIVIRMSYRHRTPNDPLGRAECGWQVGMSEEEAWDAARGTWKFNLRRLAGERYAFVVGGHTGDGAVLTVVEFDSNDVTRASDGRYEIIGKIVPADHPLRQYTTDPSRSTSRASILYVDLPEERELNVRTCRCGCGEPVRGDFLPGHDQRAIHDRIDRYFNGSVVTFLDWIDNNPPDSVGYDERNGPPGEDD
jgi:hypothetical protein